ncbi:VOC family protein [Mycolicibacterium sp.]|uniref:VOC family protein n=1 Tax=Mycolicibacterium sp. TaxID=2320850 RepID=UPI003D0E12DF
MAPAKKLAHVVLQTNRFATMRDWYLTVLDARIVYQNEMIAFLTFDDEHHRLAIAHIPGAAERTPLTVGLSHTAYTFPTLAGLLDKYEHLRALGIEPRVPVQHGVTTSLYYRDPDGNYVELQIDNFATPDEATRYMEGPEYGADMAGPTFDPAAMSAALRAGTPVSELTSRQWAAQFPQADVVALLTT